LIASVLTQLLYLQGAGRRFLKYRSDNVMNFYLDYVQFVP